eukprot:UN13315
MMIGIENHLLGPLYTIANHGLGLSKLNFRFAEIYLR